MACVTAMLARARAAGLDIQPDGSDLVVRGPAEVELLARELLDHKALVLATLDREEECRQHEQAVHRGEAVDWSLEDGALVCSTCRPGPGAGHTPAGESRDVVLPACPMCGSAGRCEGRFPTVDDG